MRVYILLAYVLGIGSMLKALCVETTLMIALEDYDGRLSNTAAEANSGAQIASGARVEGHSEATSSPSSQRKGFQNTINQQSSTVAVYRGPSFAERGIGSLDYLENHTTFERVHQSTTDNESPDQDTSPDLTHRSSSLTNTHTGKDTATAIKSTITASIVINHESANLSNPNNAQMQGTSDWCCVVNRGVKFCFKCPSATSATELEVLPRKTAAPLAMMIHGTRTSTSLLHSRMEHESDGPKALCCFTTGFVVFGCYLCRSAPPALAAAAMQSDGRTWQFEGRTGSGDGNARYKEAEGVEGGQLDGDRQAASEFVCVEDGPGRLICNLTTGLSSIFED